ncbi:hypothetical protein [Stutzerimonas xanthomarina]
MFSLELIQTLFANYALGISGTSAEQDRRLVATGAGVTLPAVRLME